jgi:hypothetical protein
MAPDHFQPHILVLPEDDANRQMARGFILEAISPLSERKIQVLPLARGWRHLMDLFLSDHVPKMRRYPERIIVLLLDFDGNGGRRNAVRSMIPTDLGDRVFVLGTLTEPEELRNSLGQHFESIGQAMAVGCRVQSAQIWDHALLRDNAGELDRLRQRALPFLFQ